MSKGNSTGAWVITLVRAGYGVALRVCAAGTHQADWGSGYWAARWGIAGAA